MPWSGAHCRWGGPATTAPDGGVLASGLVFLVSLGVALALTPLVTRLSAHLGLVDRPNPRRTELKPRGGGLAIAAGLAAGILASFLVTPGRTDAEDARIFGLLAGGAVVLVVGLLDDRFEISAGWQIAGQLVASLVAVSFGVLIDGLNNPLSGWVGTPFLEFPFWIAVGLTLFWFVGAMNTVNFIDGVDGLAGTIVGVAGAVLFVHTFALGQYSVATLPAALVGAVLGFLVFNLPPARITMGTTGAALLGFMLAGMSIVGGTKAASLLLVLGIPILDTAWLIVNRLLRGQSPWRGDRSHLHHRLQRLGLGPRSIVLVLGGVSATFGALALLMPTPGSKLMALGAMTLVTFAALVRLARATPADAAGKGADAGEVRL